MIEVNFFGNEGQHAQDINRRRILTGLEIRGVGKESSQPNDEKLSSIVAVPISKTTKLLEEISHTSQEIISLCGVMSTSKSGNLLNVPISCLHFLFGPKAEENLKVASAGGEGKVLNILMDNIKTRGIQIIETSVGEHDKKMAVIQAMTHSIISILALEEGSNIPLVQEWNTPASTISDMILLNPEFKPLMSELSLLKTGSNLSAFYLDSVSGNLSESDLLDFSTPTFNRLKEFLSNHPITLTEEMEISLGSLFSNKAKFEEMIKKLQSKHSLL